MSFFTFKKLGQVLVLTVAVFAFSVSAEDGFSHNLNIGGGSDLAWLKVHGLALGGVEDDGELNKGYISVKYKTPLRSMVEWGGVDLEYGWFTDNSMFWGLDVGFGVDSKAYIDELQIGGGLSLGYALNLPYGLRVIPGLSVGFWYSSYKYDSDDNSHAYSKRNGYDLCGPFLKLQWYFIEVMYRGLLGFYDVKGGAGSGKYAVSSKDDGAEWDHQLMVGLYLAKYISLDYGGYSVFRRLGAMVLNVPIPGLGSMILQKDYLGGGISLGLYAGGMAMAFSGTKTVVKTSQGIKYESNELTTLGYVGICTIVGGELFNLTRPWFRTNPDSRTASVPPDGFKFAAYPKDGDLQYVGAYTKSF